MIDPRSLILEPEFVASRLSHRHVPAGEVHTTAELLERKNKLQNEVDELRATSRQFRELAFPKTSADMKRATDIDELKEKLADIKSTTDQRDAEFRCISKQVEDRLLALPNLPDSKTLELTQSAIITSPDDNAAERHSATPYWTIAESLGLADWARASKLSGSGFLVLLGDGARLLRALEKLGTEIHSNSYREVCLPHMARESAMHGSGHLPKFSSGAYRVEDAGLWMLPTIEVSLLGIHQSEKIEINKLPLCYVSQSSCFRREVGNGGRDSRWRLHEYHQIELFRICAPQEAESNFDHLLKDSFRALDLLEIPFRVRQLCPADLPFAASRSYQLEVYSPSADLWMGVSTVSLFADFQARRSNIKYKDGDKSGYVVTMNASALAVSRVWGLLLEHGLQADGTVRVPKVLQSYMGKEYLSKA